MVTNENEIKNAAHATGDEADETSRTEADEMRDLYGRKPYDVHENATKAVGQVAADFAKHLAEADFASVARNARAGCVILLRLVALPSAFLALLWLASRCVHMPPKMMEALVIAASAPVAALTTVFSVKFGGDVPLSVGLVATSTLLSIVTMPPVVAVAITVFS